MKVKNMDETNTKQEQYVFRVEGIVFEEIPSDFFLDGHIVKFLKPLGDNNYRYMLVTGGFGACSSCSGTMIIGYFARTVKDAIAQQNGHGGNTRVFPIWQSKEVFKTS